VFRRLSRLIPPRATASAPTSKPPTSTTTRHPKRVVRQFAKQEGSQHLVHLTANLRNHSDTRRAKGHFERPGDRPANQHVRGKLGNLLGSPIGIRGRQFDLLTPDFASLGDLNQ
jgi:hypothetical protein